MTTQNKTPHPSPWLVLDDGQTVDGGLTIVSVSHDGFRVAHVNPDVGDGHINCEANARLIAAAPELLEALQGIMEWMKQHHPKAHSNSHKAHAAIAKATGQ
jgi:hypothetical protein